MKVKTSLEKIVENSGMEDLIPEVVVPTEEVVKKRNGKKKIVEKKLFPGYVAVKMIVTNKSWYVVRNIKGVLGFVGPDAKPVPLSVDEVINMGLETKGAVVTINMEVGDEVSVLSGPFEEFNGVVEQINSDKKTVKVLISMFGRETPVELDFDQVEKVE